MRIIQKVNIVLKTVATIAIMHFERENILDLLHLFTIVKNDKKIRQFVEIVHQMVSRIPNFHGPFKKWYWKLKIRVRSISEVFI